MAKGLKTKVNSMRPNLFTARELKELVDLDPEIAFLEVEKRHAQDLLQERNDLNQAFMNEKRKAVRDAMDNAKSSYNRFVLFLIGLLVLIVVAGIFALIGYCVTNDERASATEMKACETGNTVGCIAAIQDQHGQSGADSAAREGLYREAYRIRTGHSIVMPGDQFRRDYNGLEIIDRDNGVEVKNSSMDVYIANGSPQTPNSNPITPNSNTTAPTKK